jgi:hypothetical protein
MTAIVVVKEISHVPVKYGTLVGQPVISFKK